VRVCEEIGNGEMRNTRIDGWVSLVVLSCVVAMAGCNGGRGDGEGLEGKKQTQTRLTMSSKRTDSGLSIWTTRKKEVAISLLETTRVHVNPPGMMADRWLLRVRFRSSGGKEHTSIIDTMTHGASAIERCDGERCIIVFESQSENGVTKTDICAIVPLRWIVSQSDE